VRVPPFVRLYGGFAGDEESRGGNWEYHPTVINWGYGEQVVQIGPGYRACSMEGFTVRVDPNGPPLDDSVGILVLGSPDVSNCIVRDCYSGVLLYGSRARVYGLKVMDCRFAVQCQSGSPQIHCCRLTGAGHQQALRMQASSPIISSCLAAGFVTAAHALAGSSPRIVNCTFADNQGGLTLENASAELCNSVIAFCASGLFLYGQSSVLVRNSNVFGCTSPYVNTPDRTGQDGNISVDPLFAGRASGDYHVGYESPCREAGLNSAVDPGWGGDLDNQRRIQGRRVDIGAYEFWPDELSAGEMKDAPAEAFVRSKDMVVTEVLGNWFYAQSPDRAAGIRILRDAHGLSRGLTVRLEGNLHVNEHGEKWLEATECALTGAAEVRPFVMANRFLGGAVAGGFGLNNTGLFVSLFGRVLQVDNEGQQFTVSDGSVTGGVRVRASGLTLPPVGQTVLVSGASSLENVQGALCPVLLAAEPGDIVPM